MAEDQKTGAAAKPTQTDADKAVVAARKAQDEAVEAAQANAADATEEARKQSLETLKQQDEAKPEPSQEEADRIKAAAAAGGMEYATRQVKP